MRGFDEHNDSSQFQQSHDEWLAYVRSEIPVAEQAYELAIGRTQLFRSFYRIRQLEFPSPFAEELERIHKLHDPERTTALEALNDDDLSEPNQAFDRMRAADKCRKRCARTGFSAGAD